MPETFRVGITRDFLKTDGTLAFGNIGLDLLDRAPGITREFLESHSPELQPEQIRGFDALLVLAPSVTAATLTGADRLALVARFGVGYDNVDIVACTRAGVLVTITPDGVRRPVATSVLAYLLALSLRMFDKDRLTRAGRWADRFNGPYPRHYRPGQHRARDCPAGASAWHALPGVRPVPVRCRRDRDGRSGDAFTRIGFRDD